MNPNEPTSLKWGNHIHIEVPNRKSFDDQYLDELKSLRDPNYKPKDEMKTISVPHYLDANYLNMIRDFTENLYADNAEL